MDNEFLKHPIHLSILGTDWSQYYLKQLIIYLGNVPADVLNEILTGSFNEKILVNYYGIYWKKLIGVDTSGSQENDIFDMSETIPVESTKTYEKIVYISNISLYPEDRISEFKEKIYLTS